MKRILLVLIFSLVLFSCTVNENKKTEVSVEKKEISSNYFKEFPDSMEVGRDSLNYRYARSIEEQRDGLENYSFEGENYFGFIAAMTSYDMYIFSEGNVNFKKCEEIEEIFNDNSYFLGETEADIGCYVWNSIASNNLDMCDLLPSNYSYEAHSHGSSGGVPPATWRATIDPESYCKIRILFQRDLLNYDDCEDLKVDFDSVDKLSSMCYTQKAVYNQDQTFCDKIFNNHEREECESWLNRHRGESDLTLEEIKTFLENPFEGYDDYDDEFYEKENKIYDMIDFREGSYLACGCGCCPETEPEVVCVNDYDEFDLEDTLFNDLYIEDEMSCDNTSCSKGIKYTFCNN